MAHMLQATLDSAEPDFDISIATYHFSISAYLKGGRVQRPFLVLAESPISTIVGELIAGIWGLGWFPRSLTKCMSSLAFCCLRWSCQLCSFCVKHGGV